MPKPAVAAAIAAAIVAVTAAVALLPSDEGTAAVTPAADGPGTVSATTVGCRDVAGPTWARGRPGGSVGTDPATIRRG